MAKDDTFLIAVADSEENKPVHFENKPEHFYMYMKAQKEEQTQLDCTSEEITE